MELFRRRAYARAGLLGNPSDGYHGQALSISVRNFWADAVLYEWDRVELVLSQEDHSHFRSVQELAHDVESHGYYGGIRLVKATIKKFVDYCERERHPLHGRNFSIRYESNVPRQVGLAGSSAIIVATLRCLMDFYEIEIPLHIQPSLALSVETEELGIAAGLQDRVIQVYEGAVAMDFAESIMEGNRAANEGYACGGYEQVDPDRLPPLYVAYRSDLGEPTEVVHNDLRARHRRSDVEVLVALEKLAGLVDEGRAALEAGDAARLGAAIDRNFDLRRSICRIAPWQLEMVERARSAGASAKFAGSGGAIIGTLAEGGSFAELQAELAEIGCQTLRPLVVPAEAGPK